MTIRPLWLLLLVAGGGALAQPHDSGRSGPSETLLRALRDEMRRTVSRLQLGDLPAPYFVAYTVLETQRLSLEGEFGGLEEPRRGAMRQLQVELRAGSRQFDDSLFVDVQGGGMRPSTTPLPFEDDYDALRNEIWELTDQAYKAAVERLARKTVYRDSNNIRDAPPDLSEDPVQSSMETLPAGSVDAAFWERSVRDISGVFRRFPAVRTSGVGLNWREQHLYFVDSEGRSYVKPAHWFELTLRASAQAEDGRTQSDERQLLWQSPAHVPDIAELRAEAERLATEVTALAGAKRIETYLGPLLLEGQAAGELLSQLLANGLANPREIWAEQRWSEQSYKRGALTTRLGLRVISPLFDVIDDPTVAEFGGRPLTGHYRVDEQGIPARRVHLVERGILRDLLMSRSPAKQRAGSNGHGRGGFSAPAAAVIGNLFVEPSQSLSLDEMKARLREEARAFGLKRAILIRRVALEREREQEELLSAPVLVYEVDVDTGEETLVRDARFNAITLRALRDIVAASDERYVYNIAKPGPWRGSATLSSSIVHPSLLLSELELVPADDKPSKPPYLPHPFFAGAAGH